MRYFFEIAYQGTNYHGWQRQNNAMSVQQAVEEALSTILRNETAIVGSGRTDTGVHCRQQYFHIEVEESIDDLENLKYRLNNFLPDDISIDSINAVTDDAHARFTATIRSYQYFITQKKDAFAGPFKYLFNRPLDIKTMNEAAALLLGMHDFESFSRVKTDVNTFNCDIKEAYWEQKESELIFNITANRFLRGMVRAIVGTLLDVGVGKISVTDFKSIIESKDRKKAGAAAPAHGLYLTAVKYPQEIFI